jgi:hypothetical protein
MARARKLFPIYGSSLANNMLAAIARGRVVGDFVASYVEGYERRGILGGPARDRELDETIGREVILAMIIEVRRVLPRFYDKTQYDKLKDDQKETIEVFLRECVAALGRAWNWQGEDGRNFARDLALYSEFGSREALPKKTPKREKTRQKKLSKAPQKIAQPTQRDEPPFVGRVALLLDPSMIDQARNAARKFHTEAELLGQKLLRQTLRPAK